jgi:TRAP-type mannitol/chloroaromatic compound transport system substrate-binding protein
MGGQKMKKTRRDFLKTAGAAAVGASTLIASRKKSHAAEKPIKWRFQSIHGSGQDSFKLCQDFVNNVKTASNGRLIIDLYPNGGIVSSMEGFQACSKGVFEMHESWPSYIRGINNVFQMLANGSMQLPAIDRWVWIYEAGGYEIMEKAFNTINLHLLSTENWPAEMAHGNKNIKSMADLKGRKFRTGDARLLQKIGVAAVTLPLEDTFTALQTGAVDIAEFGNLKYNQGLGLTDIAKYGIEPDFWNVCTVNCVVVNIKAWKAIPVDLQKIVEMCLKANQVRYLTNPDYESAKLYKKLKESGKMEFIRLPAKEFVQMKKLMNEVEDEEIKKFAGLTKEAYDSMRAFQELYLPYKKYSEWWGQGLTVEEQLGKG